MGVLVRTCLLTLFESRRPHQGESWKGGVRQPAEIYWCETINYVYVATLHLVGTCRAQTANPDHLYTVYTPSCWSSSQLHGTTFFYMYSTAGFSNLMQLGGSVFSFSLQRCQLLTKGEGIGFETLQKSLPSSRPSQPSSQLFGRGPYS